MISQDQFNKLVKNRTHLYKAFTRNGFFLPVNINNTFVSKKMLVDIYMSKCHCSKYNDMKFLSCCDPPSAEILRDELAGIIEENGAYANE